MKGKQSKFDIVFVGIMIFIGISFTFIISPYLDREKERSYFQIQFKEDTFLLINSIKENDRGWLTFINKSDLYMIYLNKKNRSLVNAGDSLYHFANSDSLYLVTKNGILSNEVIYYDPTSWLHELLGDTLDIEGRYGKKPWRQ
ncbi:hypothetical protein [Flammeovirga kamogawensis]|uniref:Uncharacterized protein n=1 Tax=Flammeovirga kamogawensis TaxID=373891 RepID=A0ABX8H267_9BACT|nr:hypothetical protein [Flammeovirga kamogawensis]MBB6463777.1 hypothetical protein [Flammeovirga kamogawensis]QWG09713.1 hypothetical protein KM029_24245 [Flammeovirga kamogawensis]TRX65225.1 hypothetical protein EO216_22135 [Flammeovirga kamogawensis]